MNKVYRGSHYLFQRNEEPLGKGGNGAVYEVNTDPHIEIPVVAKFFECDKHNRNERYKRFVREIDKVNQLKDVKGILPIIDYNCPDECPTEKDVAWYLMPKANQFHVGRYRKIADKIEDMLSLAKTIQEVHSRGMFHRDIKPENILIYNGEVILSDFGLAWGLEDERITEKMERIGPYKILPPEMEEVYLDQHMDFKPADVYLFAKVLWMYIKGDNIGFRGQYNRRDDQIYLDKQKAKVLTFEPIHSLMEQATKEYPDERITITDCIEKLKLQQQVIKAKDNESSLIRTLLFEETTKRALQKSSPDIHVYEEKEQILRVVDDVLQYSIVVIQDKTGKRVLLKGTSFTIDKISENIWRLNAYADRTITRQIYFSTDKMIHRVKDTKIVLGLKPIPDDEMISLRVVRRENIIDPSNCIVIGGFGM